MNLDFGDIVLFTDEVWFVIAIDDDTQECDLMGKDGRIYYKAGIESVKKLCSTDFEPQLNVLLEKYHGLYKESIQENIDMILSDIEYSVFTINGFTYEVVGSEQNDNGQTFVILDRIDTNDATQVELSKFLQMIVTGVSQEEL